MSSLSAAVAASVHGAQAETPRAPPRVLIVDDVADHSAALSSRFAKHGFEIVEADCGAEALRLVQEQTFDVVLLDVMMPDMNGTEVLRRIREKFSASLLPIIMLTPENQAEDVVEAMKIGANDYVTKPVDFSIALARVNNQLARRRAELELPNVSGSLAYPMARPDERELPRQASDHRRHRGQSRDAFAPICKARIRDRRSRLRRAGAEARSGADIRRRASRRDDAGHGRYGRSAPAS